MEMKDLIPTNWLTEERKKRPLSFNNPLSKIHNEMNRMFNELVTEEDEFWSNGRASDSFAPKSDIIETKNEYKVFMDMPGIEEKEVEVSMDNGVLQVSGKKEHSEEIKNAQMHTTERSYGSFTKRMELPKNILEDKIEANFKNGVLEILLPKTEESKKDVKKINVVSK